MTCLPLAINHLLLSECEREHPAVADVFVDTIVESFEFE